MTIALTEPLETPTHYRFTRDEYYRMAELGFFEGKRVELIDGEIIEMAPQKNPHSLGIGLAAHELGKVFHAGHWVRNQLPLNLGEMFDPEPDVVVVKGEMRSFTDHPTTALLIVEVADSTLRFDRKIKGSLYAKAGIADYWIVNIVANVIECYRDPVADPAAKFGFSYRASQTLKAGDKISPLAMPSSEIVVADLLP